MGEKKKLPDLTKLSRSELTDLLDELTITIQDIKLQISMAKNKVHQTGEYADSQWWYDVHKAKIVVGSHIKRIERRLGKLKEERRARSLGEFFIQAAKFHLKSDSFKMLMDDARERMESAKDG